MEAEFHIHPQPLMDMDSMANLLAEAEQQVVHGHATSSPDNLAIHVYSSLAKIHKYKVIPYLPRIMASIVASLAWSPLLRTACSEVVVSLAANTIDPTRDPTSNEEALRSLCRPLLSALSCQNPPLSAGSASCLQALVESDQWRCAPLDLQELVCARGTLALEHEEEDSEGMHTVSLLRLMRSLAKLSSSVVIQGYGARLLSAGMQALQVSSLSSSSVCREKGGAAAQLLESILKVADADLLDLDLSPILGVLEGHHKMTMAAAAAAATAGEYEGVVEGGLGHAMATSICEVPSRKPGLAIKAKPLRPSRKHNRCAAAPKQQSRPSLKPYSASAWAKSSPLVPLHRSPAHIFKENLPFPSLGSGLSSDSYYQNKRNQCDRDSEACLTPLTPEIQCAAPGLFQNSSLFSVCRDEDDDPFDLSTVERSIIQDECSKEEDLAPEEDRASAVMDEECDSPVRVVSSGKGSIEASNEQVLFGDFLSTPKDQIQKEENPLCSDWEQEDSAVSDTDGSEDKASDYSTTDTATATAAVISRATSDRSIPCTPQFSASASELSFSIKSQRRDFSPGSCYSRYSHQDDFRVTVENPSVSAASSDGSATRTNSRCFDNRLRNCINSQFFNRRRRYSHSDESSAQFRSPASVVGGSTSSEDDIPLMSAAVSVRSEGKQCSPSSTMTTMSTQGFSNSRSLIVSSVGALLRKAKLFVELLVFAFIFCGAVFEVLGYLMATESALVPT